MEVDGWMHILALRVILHAGMAHPVGYWPEFHIAQNVCNIVPGQYLLYVQSVFRHTVIAEENPSFRNRYCASIFSMLTLSDGIPPLDKLRTGLAPGSSRVAPCSARSESVQSVQHRWPSNSCGCLRLPRRRNCHHKHCCLFPYLLLLRSRPAYRRYTVKRQQQPTQGSTKTTVGRDLLSSQIMWLMHMTCHASFAMDTTITRTFGTK